MRITDICGPRDRFRCIWRFCFSFGGLKPLHLNRGLSGAAADTLQASISMSCSAAFQSRTRWSGHAPWVTWSSWSASSGTLRMQFWSAQMEISVFSARSLRLRRRRALFHGQAVSGMIKIYLYRGRVQLHQTSVAVATRSLYLSYNYLNPSYVHM